MTMMKYSHCATLTERRGTISIEAIPFYLLLHRAQFARTLPCLRATAEVTRKSAHGRWRHPHTYLLAPWNRGLPDKLTGPHDIPRILWNPKGFFFLSRRRVITQKEENWKNMNCGESLKVNIS
jgi:hypothetical protein